MLQLQDIAMLCLLTQKSKAKSAETRGLCIRQRRCGVPAGPILFLASDASSFISGVHIPIAAASQVQLELEDPTEFYKSK